MGENPRLLFTHVVLDVDLHSMVEQVLGDFVSVVKCSEVECGFPFLLGRSIDSKQLVDY